MTPSRRIDSSSLRSSTFSVAFEDRAYSELGYARQAAQAIGAVPHEIVVSDSDFFGALPRLVWHEDEPIAHPSSVPLHFVSSLARQHVKVVLTGEGSDELLAGYGRYPRTLFNWRAGGVYERLVPEAVRTAVAARVPQLPDRLRRYASRSFLAMPRTAEAHRLWSMPRGSAMAAMRTSSPAPAASSRTMVRTREEPCAAGAAAEAVCMGDAGQYRTRRKAKRPSAGRRTAFTECRGAVSPSGSSRR